MADSNDPRGAAREGRPKRPGRAGNGKKTNRGKKTARKPNATKRPAAAQDPPGDRNDGKRKKQASKNAARPAAGQSREKKNSQKRRDGNGKPDDGRGERPKKTDEKTAIIYVPHLGNASVESLEGLSTRLAAVLDGDDSEPKARYVVEDAAQAIRFGRSRPKPSGQSISVVRKVNDDKRSSLDLYEFDYSRSFSERFDKKSTLMKSGILLTTVLFNLGRLAGSLVGGRSQERKDVKRAGVIVTLLLAAVAITYALRTPRNDWEWLPWVIGIVAVAVAALVYFSKASTGFVVAGGIGAAVVVAALVVLERVGKDSFNVETIAAVAFVAGLVCVVHVSLKVANEDLGQRTQLAIAFFVMSLMTAYALILLGAAGTLIWDGLDGKENTAKKWRDPLTVAAVGLTAAGVTFAPKKARKQVNDVTTHLLGAVRYLSMGDGRDSETGRLYDMIEHLSELDYEHIDIIGYSFGSVVALDALYPNKDGRPPHRVIKEVGRLVTVGCPAKTIGTFWPHFWEGRDLDSWDGDWVNVYSPYDVLSCEFDPPLAGNEGGSPDDEKKPFDKAAVWITPKNPAARSPRPCEEKVFNPGPSTDDLSPLQHLALGGLRAHANYWQTPYDDDRGAVALFGSLWSRANSPRKQHWEDLFKKCEQKRKKDREKRKKESAGTLGAPDETEAESEAEETVAEEAAAPVEETVAEEAAAPVEEETVAAGGAATGP